MVGPKGAVNQDELWEVFLSFESDIIKDDRVVVPKSEIWRKINVIFPISNPKALYTAALRWYSAQNKKQNISEVICDEFDEISWEESEGGSTSLNTTVSLNSESINFNIYLSAEVWKSISPVPVRYNRKADQHHNGGTRTFMTLKKGIWTNVILERISKHRKNLICNWSFNRAKVYIRGTFYVVLTAKCVNCEAILRGFIKKKPENESEAVKICFTIKYFYENRHVDNSKTVKNTGEKVKKVQESVKSALALQQEMATESIPMFGKSKGRTFSSNAIRCAKFRMRNKKKMSDCVYTSLSYLQAMKANINTIHMIGMNPLIVLYVSPDQLRLFIAYKKHNPYVRISCDATGSLVHILENFDGSKRQQILLFSLCISDDFQISVHSLLTEKQDANFIKYWLEEFIRLGGSIPNEFICDMSPALLSAGVQAFGKKSSMTDYLNSVFNILNGVKDVRPWCFVRIDIAHFIKDVAKCNHLKNVRLKHRDFFIRSTALMIKMRSLTQIREHILAVMVVALSQTEGNSIITGKETQAESFKKSIINKIKGIDAGSVEYTLITNNLDQTAPQTLSEVDESENKQHADLLKYLDSVKSRFTDWIADIEKEARAIVEQSDEGDRDNLMFNLSFVGFFRKLCKLVPLWTAACCDMFESPYETSSSSNVECDFKNVKLSLKDIITCRADVFVQRHLQMIDGAVKIASQKYLSYVDEDSSESVDENISESGSDNDDFTTEKSAAASTEAIQKLTCMACENNHLPSDAHTCFMCDKNVHLLPGCSLSIGGEEGFGEKRICTICSTKAVSEKSTGLTKKSTKQSTKPLKKSSRIAKSKQQKRKVNLTENYNNELNHKESWKGKKTKRSHYVRPSPHWDLITNVDKKVKLGMLHNGSISKITHRVNNKTVGLKNTCAFDSVVQVLAGAYAYIEHYRPSCENREDNIFQIAILLAKNYNAKKINNLRASLLINTFHRISYEIVVSEVIRKTLETTPSYSDVLECPACTFSKQNKFPIVNVSENVYGDDMKNLEKAILANIPSTVTCECSAEFHLIREFGDHLFVVSLILCLFVSLILSMSYNKVLKASCKSSSASMYEESAVFRVCDVPLVLNISGKKFVLFGLITFHFPLLEDDIGHYTAAIRLNNKWEVYDDLRSKPFNVSANTKAVIHCIFYIKFDSNDGNSSNPNEDDGNDSIVDVSQNSNQVSEDEEEVSGFEVQHSDESLYRLYHP